MSDLVLEVTAGVGGQEAMLFTAEVCWDLQDEENICVTHIIMMSGVTSCCFVSSAGV